MQHMEFHTRQKKNMKTMHEIKVIVVVESDCCLIVVGRCEVCAQCGVQCSTCAFQMVSPLDVDGRILTR